MKTTVLIAVGLAVLSGCDEFLPAVSSGPLPLENGFRSKADKCRHVGVNDFTQKYSGPRVQLAACPINYEGLGLFVFENAANWEAEVQRYVLFTVPTP